MASTRVVLRDSIIRPQVGDADKTIFGDDELNGYIDNAIRAYSVFVPREVSGLLTLQGGRADGYDAPADLFAVVSLKVGNDRYSVTEIFGGTMTISPTPAQNAVAVLKYRASHVLPTDENHSSSYEDIDEPLIVKHVKAECWERLAGTKSGDGTVIEYTEGDISERYGDAEKEFRSEAESLYQEFRDGCASAAERVNGRRPLAGPPSIAKKVSRKVSSRGPIVMMP